MVFSNNNAFYYYDRIKGLVDLIWLLFKKVISLEIYIFRGHIRAHIKGNEMLFEIIYRHCGLLVWFQCYTGEGVKIHRKRALQENRKSRGDSNSING